MALMPHHPQAERPVPAAGGEVRAFLCVRDEMLRLPWLLHYHRALGVDRFLVLDNESRDGTTAYLREQPDVHLFLQAGSYSAARSGQSWLETLLDSYGGGNWCLLLDADEQFVYPACERLNLHGLCRHLDEVGAEAVFAVLVDMYADRPIRDTAYRPGTRPVDACRYFDPAPYQRIQHEDFPHVIVCGGVRARVFWKVVDGKYPSPWLSKVPLMRWRRGFRLKSSTHLVTAMKLAEFSAALLHFKFLDDFAQRVHEAVARREHVNGAQEYRVYANALERDPALSLYCSESVRYDSSDDLVRHGLIYKSPALAGFLHSASSVIYPVPAAAAPREATDSSTDRVQP